MKVIGWTCLKSDATLGKCEAISISTLYLKKKTKRVNGSDRFPFPPVSVWLHRRGFFATLPRSLNVYVCILDSRLVSLQPWKSISLLWTIMSIWSAFCWAFYGQYFGDWPVDRANTRRQTFSLCRCSVSASVGRRTNEQSCCPLTPETEKKTKNAMHLTKKWKYVTCHFSLVNICILFVCYSHLVRCMSRERKEQLRDEARDM